MKIQITVFFCFVLLAAKAQCLRQIAVNDYLTNYEPNNFDLNELAFTGDIDACFSGSYCSYARGEPDN